MKTLELNQEELYKLMISLSPHTELDGYRELQNKIRKAMGFPVGFEYDQSYDNVARLMMEAMQYDICINGWQYNYTQALSDEQLRCIGIAIFRHLAKKRNKDGDQTEG